MLLQDLQLKMLSKIEILHQDQKLLSHHRGISDIRTGSFVSPGLENTTICNNNFLIKSISNYCKKLIDFDNDPTKLIFEHIYQLEIQDSFLWLTKALLIIMADIFCQAKREKAKNGADFFTFHHLYIQRQRNIGFTQGKLIRSPSRIINNQINGKNKMMQTPNHHNFLNS